MQENTLLRIKENFSIYTDTDKKLAEFIMYYPKEVVALSAQEIGQLSETSAAAVMRFIRKLNYDGLMSFKLNLDKAISMQNNSVSDNLIIDQSDSLNDLIVKLKSKISEVITRTASLIYNEKIERAIKKLSKADNVYLFGLGASALVAEDLHQKLIKIDKKSFFNRDSHVQLVYSSNCKKNDIAILFSYGGQTKEILLCASEARKNGAYVVAITGNMGGMLAKESDIVIQLPCIETENGLIRLGAIESRYSMLYISDLIFMNFAAINHDELINKLEKSTAIIKRYQ